MLSNGTIIVATLIAVPIIIVLLAVKFQQRFQERTKIHKTVNNSNAEQKDSIEEILKSIQAIIHDDKKGK